VALAQKPKRPLRIPVWLEREEQAQLEATIRDTPVDVVTSLLSSSDAVLVSRKGMIVGIITRSDVLKLIS